MRVINEESRGVVLVYESAPKPGEPGPRTLVFEWGSASSRITRYPEEWRRLADDEVPEAQHFGVEQEGRRDSALVREPVRDAAE